MSVGDLIWGLFACTGVLAGAIVAAGYAVQVAERKRRERVRSRVPMVRRVSLADTCRREKDLPPLRMVGKH